MGHVPQKARARLIMCGALYLTALVTLGAVIGVDNWRALQHCQQSQSFNTCTHAMR